MSSKPADDTLDTPQPDPMDGSQGKSHLTPPPTIISKKRKCRKEVIQLLEKPMKVVTFVVKVMPSTELKKLITKHEMKSVSFEFRHGEDPWDTLLTWMLLRIDQILSPKKIGIEDYEVTFHIPCILPKPGLPLVSKEHYRTLSTQINKIALQTPTVNIIILQKPAATVMKEVPTNSSTQDEELDAGSSNMS
ncbi:hypothetical protein PISMIDRAFT_25330 [Pisolithus microcarpus 441]|uniref:Uncharacterized protein n=1 Tax=Pisolithus microcarpus 441 TaxID=765257 RepID=A0A0C9YDZ0_9AGAM|nr:hypothetical protein BKA83DRAFT_25330 [Pisolithus microcarpus]KIK14881.1 hypothetical protein PISMIDRAFT_25330 [Pisolithus microcarpus 441]